MSARVTILGLGTMGRTIRVMNIRSKKVIEGVVAGPSRVTVATSQFAQ